MQQQSKTINPRIQAQLKFFARDKGYGFLKREGKDDIWVSAKALLDSNININKIAENDVFEFDLVPVKGKGGRAEKIRLIAKARDAGNSRT